MRLESIAIKRFRSIETVELPNCGSFNVLIGKNNSGKSNILTAVNAFFACIQDQDVVALNPPIGKEIDFFKAQTTDPIEITPTFSLALAERASFIQDVVAEAPQMKHALDGLDTSLRLNVRLRVLNRPRRCAYISMLAFVEQPQHMAPRRNADRIVLEVSGETALEVADRQTKIRTSARLAESLRQLPSTLDDDDLRRFQKEGMPFYRYFPHGEVEFTPELSVAIRSILGESKTASDLHRALQNYITKEKGTVEALRQEPLKNKVHTFSGDEAVIPTYAANLLRRLSQLKVHYLTDRRKQIGKDEAERLLTLKVSRGGPEVLRNIQETVASLLGVKIDAFQSAASTRSTERTAELDVDDFLVEVNGSGIREALRLVLDNEFEHPNIILTEEPEMHLHPALETTMMQYLKRISNSCQVFITTHSTSFLDTAEMKNVYLISKPDSTRVQLMDFEEAESQIPKELGLRLSSLFMYDRLVFVEAPSDESILREWSSKLSVNLSQANVGFVAMGGARDINYFAAETTLNFLTKRQVKLWFLVDRDEREAEDIAKLERALGGRGVIKVLTRREMENYLIWPRAIIEFIRVKRELAAYTGARNLPSVEELQQTIDEAAEQLKSFAVQKRIAKVIGKPLYMKMGTTSNGPSKEDMLKSVNAELDKHITGLQAMKARAEEEYQHQTQAIQSRWSTEKLSIVPGDDLLKLVCDKYGVRFKKERDGVRLASLMNESEIDEEIKRLIREIGT